MVVTVDRHDLSLLERMNIQTDARIGNQSDFEATEQVAYNGHTVTMYSTTERGVGKNRNLVLDRSAADVCILADDDMRFVDGYPDLVREMLLKAPEADLWICNLIEKHPRRYVNRKFRRIRPWNYARYGAARIVVRRESLARAGLRFSLLFGGGARYGSGEDTLFLKNCLKKKLTLVAVPYAIAEIDQEAASTWFTGYDPKFFHDKGALYAALSPKTAPLYCLRYLLKYHRKYRADMEFGQAFRYMREGIREYTRLYGAESSAN